MGDKGQGLGVAILFPSIAPMYQGMHIAMDLRVEGNTETMQPLGPPADVLGIESHAGMALGGLVSPDMQRRPIVAGEKIDANDGKSIAESLTRIKQAGYMTITTASRLI